jgi:cell wall-associated NlpC family hydrolase
VYQAGAVETEQRRAFVEEAMSWVGTPYALGAHLKGAGIDCGLFLVEMLIAGGFAGRADFDDLGVFSHDWYNHSQSERYLLKLLKHANKVMASVAYRVLAGALPGDLVITKTNGSPRFNHGGVVVAWPRVIHAVLPRVEAADASRHELWAYREVEIHSPWPRGSA